MIERNEAGRTEIPVLEWLLGGIGALMVAGAIGFLAWSGSVQGDSPPDIRVEVKRVLEQKNGWLLNKMNSADPRFVTALACMIPGIPNGIIPYVAQRCDMRLYSFVFAIAASSWINILLNCIAGHFLARGEYMFTFIAFGLQLVILAVVAMNKEKILGTDKKTEAR